MFTFVEHVSGTPPFRITCVPDRTSSHTLLPPLVSHTRPGTPGNTSQQEKDCRFTWVHLLSHLLTLPRSKSPTQHLRMSLRMAFHKILKNKNGVVSGTNRRTELMSTGGYRQPTDRPTRGSGLTYYPSYDPTASLCEVIRPSQEYRRTLLVGHERRTSRFTQIGIVRLSLRTKVEIILCSVGWFNRIRERTLHYTLETHGPEAKCWS